MDSSILGLMGGLGLPWLMKQGGGSSSATAPPMPGMQPQANTVDRSVPNLPQMQGIMPNAPQAMPQGMNQQAGLLSQNTPMQTNQLMQAMQGLNSPYLKFLQGGMNGG